MNTKSSRSSIFARIGVIAFLVAFIAPLAVSAANITAGSLLLGDPRPGQTTSYTFSGASFTASTIRCIQLQLDDAADGSGSPPAGLDISGATLDASTTLITDASWTEDNTVAGMLEITFATGENPAGSGTLVWTGIDNGNTDDTTYYGIINTYGNVDCSTGGPIDTTTVAFMYKDGALVSLTVEPSLVFTVAGVDSAQTVNGATTSLTSTATAIDFDNDVSASTSGISAHDVTVGTNGSGFTLYLRQTGGLTDGTNTIDAWTGTHATPSAFPAAGADEAWGYTTNDSSLAGGTATRFTSPGNYWAGMPTVNELVADSSTIGSQTSRIGHQIAIDTSTPSGNYSTTLVYTAAGSY